MENTSLCKCITKAGCRCSRKSTKTGYCSQHDQQQKIEMYKKELKKMHQRMRMYSEKTNDLFTKLYDIEKLDFIKYKLSQLSSNRSYRDIASDIRFKTELEQIFDLPFDEIEGAYMSMVYRRNALVHKYTMCKWTGERVPNEIKKITRRKRAQLN